MARLEAAQEDAAAQLTRIERDKLLLPDDRELFANAARVAWTFADRHYHPATGLIAPLGSYQLATVWDIGSMLASLYSARGLKLLSEDVYRERLHKPALPHARAAAVILRQSPGQFDPTLLAAFTTCHDQFERIYREIGD